MKRTLVAMVQDHPGVLNRVVSLIRRRAFNIESLAVAHSETPGVSRMALVVDAADAEQIVKQLYRLIEVLKVRDVTDAPAVEREMVLLRVHAPSARRAEIVAMASVFGARTLDVGASSMVLEMTGAPDKVQSFIDVIRPFGLKEMMRTGRVAMARAAKGAARAHRPVPALAAAS